jgi:putative transposase
MSSHYRSHRDVVFSCKFHIVWRPKYRRSVLVGVAPRAIVKLYIENQKHV